MLLGAGLMAYRKMLMSLSISFIFMSLFMAPVIYEYHKGTGLKDNKSASAMDRLSIANLGYSSL